MLRVLLDLLHYLIGLIILGFVIWIIVKIHTYFSKDNILLDEVLGQMKQTQLM